MTRTALAELNMVTGMITRHLDDGSTQTERGHGPFSSVRRLWQLANDDTVDAIHVRAIGITAKFGPKPKKR